MACSRHRRSDGPAEDEDPDAPPKNNEIPMRQLIALETGRCLFSASVMFAMFSSGELLLEAIGGNRARAQRIQTAVGSVTALTSFLITPYAGALMDAYGRKQVLVAAPLVCGLARLWVARKPSLPSYVAYRMLLVSVCAPYFSAGRAAVADVLDRSSDRYTRVTQKMEMVRTAVRMVALWLAGRVTSSRKSMAIAGSVALGSAAASLLVDETLPAESRRPVQWKELRNPLASIKFFSKSPSLTKLCWINLLLGIPAMNNTVMMLRRQRFQWGMQENAQQAWFGQLFSLGAAVTVAPTLQQLGCLNTLQWSQRLAAICNFVNVFAVDARWLKVNAVLGAFLEHGCVAFDRTLSKEAIECGAGSGEMEAAVANVDVLPSLVVPLVFTEMYARAPAAVCMLCGVMQLANAEVAVPAMWPKDSEALSSSPSSKGA